MNSMESRTRTLSQEPLEDEWTQYEDVDEIGIGESFPHRRTTPLLFELPPNLHPAVTVGGRVSSCYFSLDSENNDPSNSTAGGGGSVAEILSHLEEASFTDDASAQGAGILYQDILMHVLSYLDAPSLAAFSETAKRPNFEVFYFLQLQLQAALLLGDTPPSDTANYLAVLAGSSRLSRLAHMDPVRARALVDEYLQSNSTLRTLPLSHSLEYFRRVLQRSGMVRTEGPPSNQTLASAALLFTVVGAAVMSGSASDMAAVADSFGTELPNMLFRVGFVGSALMATRNMSKKETGATATSSTTTSATTAPSNQNTTHRNQMREAAEHIAKALHDIPSAMMRGEVPDHLRFPSMMEMRTMLLESLAGNEHHEGGDSEGDQERSLVDDSSQAVPDSKVPSGSVGAYTRVITKATNIVTESIKQTRKERFLALPEENQRQLSLAFLDACSSDNTLWLVKQMVQTIDVDGFYVGTDGIETCALHTAAAHDAAQVLSFLCQGADFGEDTKKETLEDGGCCNINLCDGNGWTAIHFAAGSNAVQALQILGSKGADLTVQASNGYTPLQWALRLCHQQAANKLKELLAEQGAEPIGWMSRQPLTQIANRFFAMIPTQ